MKMSVGFSETTKSGAVRSPRAPEGLNLGTCNAGTGASRRWWAALFGGCQCGRLPFGRVAIWSLIQTKRGQQTNLDNGNNPPAARVGRRGPQRASATREECLGGGEAGGRILDYNHAPDSRADPRFESNGMHSTPF
jgi:hypothetical protein